MGKRKNQDAEIDEQKPDYLSEEEAKTELEQMDEAGEAPEPQHPEDREQSPETTLEEDDLATMQTASVTASEHNPHGLDVHERLHKLLQTLKKHGIHHAEEAHPRQNPQTTPSKFASE